MAKELEITPLDIKNELPNVSFADMLIVGSGTYGGKPGKEMVAYLENLEPVTGKRAACFSSCAGDASKTLAAMEDLLKEKGYTVVGCFSCFGKFAGLAKRGHPTEEELNQAREFAKNLKTSKQ
jgi:flavorubredoxin